MKPTVEELRRFVGNPYAFAVQHNDGSYTPKREALTDEVLEAHLRGERTVGTYIGHQLEPNGDTLSRTLCFDIDTGDQQDLLRVENGLMLLGISDRFRTIEFSGKKGWHVWVLLDQFRPNSELRRVGRAALQLGEVDCEVYPKQDEVKDLGNLVKLPGGLHRVSGKYSRVLGGVMEAYPIGAWTDLLGQLPEEVHARRSGGEVRFPCMTAIQEYGAEEGSRNIQLFHLAAMLRRAGVDDTNVESIIRRTNTLGGDPLDGVELEALLDSSTNAGPICSQLPKDRQCGELCILERTKGLYDRPGQLRHAGVGEFVVVRVSGRHADIVEFEHDDVGKMKGVLR